jgi:hypothetical protein
VDHVELKLTAPLGRRDGNLQAVAAASRASDTIWLEVDDGDPE